MPEYPSGTVAFLFTDIEGSTQRWENQREAMQQALQRHFTILEEAIAAQNGVLFKTVGDAVQAAFPTVPAAVAAAIAAQIALRREDWGELGPLRVRMAVHVGDATPRDGDYLAPILNRLARVLGAGYGEQILLTDAARSLAAALPVGYALQDLGRHRLRDLLEAERIFQVAGPGLPAEFPPLKSLERHLNNLPAQPTPLVDRESELAALGQLLVTPDVRLVTLVGPGGTGKTRLGLQAAAESLDAFADGVWWVPLAAISDPALVLQAIAAPLGVRESGGEPLRHTLAAHLRVRKVLLLLDNLEQVLEVAADVQFLLEAAPGLVILATSRAPLRLRVERELPTAPLPLPQADRPVSLDDALASPAVRLFVERAQAVKRGFTLNAANVADIVTICQRLDGLPLAIELAAARIRVLTPAALLARLDRRLTILTGGARDLPERQQTLRAAIAWSHDLLNAAEQALFARLGVFTGGFALEAAETVCGAADGLPLDLFDGIDSLVQMSLLRQEESATGEARFSMLETIREFAHERLLDLPEVDELRRAHADAYLQLAESANWDDFAAQAELLNRLEADHANLRQAIRFYEQQGPDGLLPRVRLTAALAYFWWVRGYFSEGRRLLESAIASRAEIPAQDCVAAISGAALLAEAQGDLERAQALYEEALAIRRETGDTEGIARSLTGLGAVARQRGDLDVARARHQEALDAWRAVGDAHGTAGALLDLGFVQLLEGAYEDAEPALRESLRLFARLQDDAGEANAWHGLGLLAMSTGILPAAIERFGESLRCWRTLSNQQMIATDLANLGEAHHLSGALDAAAPRYAEALSIFETLGDPVGRAYVLCQLGLLALDRGNAAEAQRLLVESLRLRWGAGERGAAADTLEALAEAAWRLGDIPFAARLIASAALVREETGIARQPVYQERYGPLFDAIGAAPSPTTPLDVDSTVAAALGQLGMAPSGAS